MALRAGCPPPGMDGARRSDQLSAAPVYLSTDETPWRWSWCMPSGGRPCTVAAGRSVSESVRRSYGRRQWERGERSCGLASSCQRCSCSPFIMGAPRPVVKPCMRSGFSFQWQWQCRAVPAVAWLGCLSLYQCAWTTDGAGTLASPAGHSPDEAKSG